MLRCHSLEMHLGIRDSAFSSYTGSHKFQTAGWRVSRGQSYARAEHWVWAGTSRGVCRERCLERWWWPLSGLAEGREACCAEKAVSLLLMHSPSQKAKPSDMHTWADPGAHTLSCRLLQNRPQLSASPCIGSSSYHTASLCISSPL